MLMVSTLVVLVVVDGKPPKPLKKVLMPASKTLSSDDDDYGDNISGDADGDDLVAEQRHANRATSKSQLL